MNGQTFTQNPRKRGKSHHTLHEHLQRLCISEEASFGVVDRCVAEVIWDNGLSHVICHQRPMVEFCWICKRSVRPVSLGGQLPSSVSAWQKWPWAKLAHAVTHTRSLGLTLTPRSSLPTPCIPWTFCTERKSPSPGTAKGRRAGLCYVCYSSPLFPA